MVRDRERKGHLSHNETSRSKRNILHNGTSFGTRVAIWTLAVVVVLFITPTAFRVPLLVAGDVDDVAVSRFASLFLV
jgi:hypothetical protein